MDACKINTFCLQFFHICSELEISTFHCSAATYIKCYVRNITPLSSKFYPLSSSEKILKTVWQS